MTKSTSSLAAPISWGVRATPPSKSEVTVPSPNTNPETLPSQPLGQVALLGLCGVALYLLSFAFEQSGYLGFFVAAPWAWMVIDARRLPRWGLAMLYGCGVLLWIGLRLLASGTTDFMIEPSDLMLTLYLAVYLPAFIWIGRVGREALHLPVMLWLPVVWTALECVRFNLFAGFSLGSLAHAVAHLTEVLQIADLFGSYGLGAWMVASGSAVAQLFWTLRRVRFLERNVVVVPGEEELQMVDVAKLVEDERGFTSAGRFRPQTRVPSQGGANKKPSIDSLHSMKSAVRRNRDLARDRDLVTAAFSILFMAASIVLAISYSRSRVEETANWKKFEGYRYVVNVIGGRIDDSAFEKSVKSEVQGLVVYATSDSAQIFRGDASHSALSISPKKERKTEPIAESENARWVATMRRFGGQFANYDVGESLDGARWSKFYRPLASHPIAFPRDDQDVLIRVLPVFAYGATVEQTLNDALHGYLQRGKSIDAAAIVIEPSLLDGSRWPKLMHRSVILAATANRCPLIALVPDHDSFIAAGDGSFHQASAVDASSSEIVSFSAMIDPRESLYASSGEWPAFVSLVCVGVLVLGRALFNLIKKSPGVSR